MSRYPDVKLYHIVAVLAMRGDLNKNGCAKVEIITIPTYHCYDNSIPMECHVLVDSLLGKLVVRVLLLISSLFSELTATTVGCSSNSGLGNVWKTHSAQVNYNQDPSKLRERERESRLLVDSTSEIGVPVNSSSFIHSLTICDQPSATLS